MFNNCFLLKNIMMKNLTHSKIGLLVLFSIVITNCDLIKMEANYPGISIYKTNGDYFNMVDMGMKGDRIVRYEGLHGAPYKLTISKDDTVYNRRVYLDDGYVLDTEADERYDVFLNLSFKEYFIMEEKFETLLILKDTLRKYILDKDPYVEFYRETIFHQKFSSLNIMNDTAEINNIIRNGEIEKYFERIK